MLTSVVTQRACRFVTKAEQKMSAFTSELEVQSHSWEKNRAYQGERAFFATCNSQLRGTDLHGWMDRWMDGWTDRYRQTCIIYYLIML